MRFLFKSVSLAEESEDIMHTFGDFVKKRLIKTFNSFVYLIVFAFLRESTKNECQHSAVLNWLDFALFVNNKLQNLRFDFW